MQYIRIRRPSRLATACSRGRFAPRLMPSVRWPARPPRRWRCRRGQGGELRSYVIAEASPLQLVKCMLRSDRPGALGEAKALWWTSFWATRGHQCIVAPPFVPPSLFLDGPHELDLEVMQFLCVQERFEPFCEFLRREVARWSPWLPEPSEHRPRVETLVGNGTIT